MYNNILQKATCHIIKNTILKTREPLLQESDPGRRIIPLNLKHIVKNITELIRKRFLERDFQMFPILFTKIF